MDKFHRSFSEFAEEKRPSQPEIARVLRHVRREQHRPRPTGHLWALGIGGWVLALVSLILLAKQAHSPPFSPELSIQNVQEWVPQSSTIEVTPTLPSLPLMAAAEASSTALVTSSPPPPHKAAFRPSLPKEVVAENSATVVPFVAPPDLSASAVPFLFPSESNLVTARDHLFRIKSLLTVIRESGTSAHAAPEQHCFAASYQKLLEILSSAEQQFKRIESMVLAKQGQTFAAEMEHLLHLRQSADAIFRESRFCFQLYNSSLRYYCS